MPSSGFPQSVQLRISMNLAHRGAFQTRWADLPRCRARPAQLPCPRHQQLAQQYHQRDTRASSNPDKSAYKSFDSDEDLDKELTNEFSKLINPKKMQQVAEHLDLAWKIGKNRKKIVCEACTGSGEGECNWCHGTGFLTVGDSLFCSTSGNCDCPVCTGKGYTKCEKCRGTGYRAGWLEQGSQP